MSVGQFILNDFENKVDLFDTISEILYSCSKNINKLRYDFALNTTLIL